MKFLIIPLLLISSIVFGAPPSKPPPKPLPKPGSSPPPPKSPSKPAPGSGSGSYPSGSSTPPTNDELCGCYNIDLICDPFTNNKNEICYYYKIEKISNNNYCKPIEYLSLGTGNLTQCGLTSTDIQSSLLSYAPKCYGIDPLYDGTCNNGGKGVPGIKIKVNPPPPPPSGSGSGSGSGSYPSQPSSSSPYTQGSGTGQKPPPPPPKGSGSGSYAQGSGSGSYPSGPPPPPPPKESSEYMVVSMCFDADNVSGLQENGQISIKTGSGRSKCDVMDILPNFCMDDGDNNPDPVEATLTPTTTAESGGINDPDTPTPSMAPTYIECSSTDALNIGFLLDESGSIDNNEWDTIKQFVERVISFDVSPQSYVSLFEYASLPAFKQFLDWTGPKSITESKIIRSLDKNKYNPSGQTETWDAVNRVLDNFHDYKQDCTDNCYQRKDILFLVTDAEPTDKAGAPRQTCPYMIDRMEQSDVDIIIILIDPNGDIDPSKVSCLDTKDNGSDVITLNSFDINNFNEIESRIRNKICNNNYPQSNGDRPDANPWQYDDGLYGLGPVPDRAGTGKHGKLDAEPQTGSHQASGNAENMDESQHKHNNLEDDNDNTPWIPIIAGIVFIALLIFGGISYFIFKSKLNGNKDESECVAVVSPGDDDDEITVQDKANQIYGNDEGNASIIMV